MSNYSLNKCINIFKDTDMLLKLLDVVIKKQVSNKDYNMLMKYFTETEQYEYCEQLKRIKDE